MRITVLAVPHCPNLPVVRQRIAAALDGRAVEVDVVEVRDETEAVRRGMTGSPTVLIDGIDPFAVPGAMPSLSCRLYRDTDGRPEGAPNVRALRGALAGPPGGRSRAAREQGHPDQGVSEPTGRDGRGRRAPAEGGRRATKPPLTDGRTRPP
ncbi:thioredoxin family protein [Embleya hyalina]|uniref:Thioredoxin-like fold domain-containing protein n=1 Tax=Embleya hyalina TaxID=516124 RepID=A0A401YMP5_9ACTN|nr:thioredoxin family protein [Embleya hyalina]GCD95857.1 hypothetical protein EHYA_03541 [Embleya hyalina]